MLYLDVLRGEDSTGVAAISNAFGDKPEIELFKTVGSPSDFFYEHSKWQRNRDFTSKPVSVMIGHNRFATQGKVNEENAHPFEFDNVVGAHNGTVSQTSLKDFHSFKDFVVDSQIIYSHLSHSQSIDEVWKEADGAMALVWWDKVQNKLNIIRNNQRTLTVCYSHDDKTVFWASETWMIMVAAMRQGVKLKDPFDVKPNKLHTFECAEDGRMFHTERDLPPFVAKPVVNYYNGPRGGYPRSYLDDEWWDDAPAKPPKVLAPPSNNNTDKTLIIREWNDTPYVPSATAFLEDGTAVKVNVPYISAKEAKDKIIGRGQANGYYVAKRLYRSTLQGADFWCNWADLTYIRLKPGGHVLRKDNEGFEINFGRQQSEYAPWFEPNQFLVQGAWENRVQCGCLNCKEVPNWGSRSDIVWVGREDFFCHSCTSLPLVQDIIQEINQQKSA